ncbi:hypothetical protein TWF730_008539 [Orbilia blumenaviensis]|uniref:NADP-dependent oxidoreductase domain-containing protein n=1 Tax=Orbilia blumenaviensis TaxID=1796055 RepID=A0AAV9V3C7_9PEZI
MARSRWSAARTKKATNLGLQFQAVYCLLGDKADVVLHVGQIQTKFTPAKFHHDYEGEKPFDKSKSIPDQIAESATSSIANLNPESSRTAALTGNGEFINYIDAILLHSPLEDSYMTLVACKVLEQHIPHTMRHWGISNVKLPLLKWLAEHPKITIKPKIVQNRFSASNNYDKDVRKYCRENNITYQAFGVLKNQELLEILDAATNEQHMKDNLRCLAWMTENVENAVSLKQLAENLIG